MSTSQPTNRRCRECGEVFPIDRFRRRKRGCESRVRQCSRCRNAAERRRYIRARNARIDRTLGPALGSLANAPIAAVPALVDSLLRRFGGHAGLARSWKMLFDRTLSKRPAIAEKSLRAVLRLLQAVDELNLARDQMRRG